MYNVCMICISDGMQSQPDLSNSIQQWEQRTYILYVFLVGALKLQVVGHQLIILVLYLLFVEYYTTDCQ